MKHSEKSIEQRENERISFVLNRDGLEKALAFCVQTILLYEAALIATHNPYGQVYEKELLGSIKQMKHFITTGELIWKA